MSVWFGGRGVTGKMYLYWGVMGKNLMTGGGVMELFNASSKDLRPPHPPHFTPAPFRSWLVNSGHVTISGVWCI